MPNNQLAKATACRLQGGHRLVPLSNPYGPLKDYTSCLLCDLVFNPDGVEELDTESHAYHELNAGSARMVARRIHASIGSQSHPVFDNVQDYQQDQPYIDEAQERIDDAIVHDDAVVKKGEGGAFVECWLWVDDEEIRERRGL